MNQEALSCGLKEWSNEYNIGKKMIQDYLAKEYESIYKIKAA